MRYIENKIFEPTGGQIVVKDENHDGEEHNATVGEVFKLILNYYQPTKEVQLRPSEIRSFNRLLDILDGMPQFGDFYGLEDTDAELLKKITTGFAPLMLMTGVQFWRNVPALEDILSSAPREIPGASETEDEGLPPSEPDSDRQEAKQHAAG